MKVKQFYAENDGVKLHYLDTVEQGREAALVMVPGGLGRAEIYLDEMAELQPRRCVALTPRGCGKSSKPTSGYSPAHQVADVAAVLTHAELEHYVIFAYSMSVPAALHAALSHDPPPAGVIVGDYPARFPALPLEWVERTVMQLGSEVPAFVPQAMQAESTAHPIWDDISGLTCPVLLMRGSGDGSLLTDEDADAYKAALPHAEEVIFEGSDHELWRPDYDRFMDAIREFLARIDKNGRVT